MTYKQFESRLAAAIVIIVAVLLAWAVVAIVFYPPVVINGVTHPSSTITFEGPTADDQETTFVIADPATADETWTISSPSGVNTFDISGPHTLTFYFGNDQCGQLKCDGETISFTGDIDKSAEKFVEFINTLLRKPTSPWLPPE